MFQLVVAIFRVETVEPPVAVEELTDVESAVTDVAVGIKVGEPSCKRYPDSYEPERWHRLSP